MAINDFVDPNHGYVGAWWPDERELTALIIPDEQLLNAPNAGHSPSAAFSQLSALALATEITFPAITHSFIFTGGTTELDHLQVPVGGEVYDGFASGKWLGAFVCWV
jgi:hypothetical protein